MTAKQDMLGFLATEHTPPAPKKARFHVLPVPYEASVSYGGGTALAPRAILEASQQLEVFDGYGNPSEQGIYTHPPVNCEGEPEAVLDRVTTCTREICKMGGLPVLLGGEHSVTFGAIRALLEEGQSFGVIQFDAHADLRDTYEDSRWSHACVMRRIMEQDVPIMQIGVRSLSPAEVIYRQEQHIAHVDAGTLMRRGLETLVLPDDFPECIYVTMDIDVLDASVMPATGTPEPGGLDWYTLMDALQYSIRDRTVLGCDLVELAPIAGFHAYDFTAARLLYNVFGVITRAGQSPQSCA